MKTTKLPVGLKGIMTVSDARRAVDMGVRLIWVSNHGGRQLDQTQSTIEALPPIADAVAGRAEIMVDGGFNRGTDVIKALARGAAWWRAGARCCGAWPPTAPTAWPACARSCATSCRSTWGCADARSSPS